MNNHVMIDLETMGLTPQNAIVSIGAVRFDPTTGKYRDTFYDELDWREQQRPIDQDTFAWWNKQPEAVRDALSGIEELPDVLRALSKWLPRGCIVWGNGACFDISMLEDAYRQCKIDVPWRFYNVRDCRTIRDMYEFKRGGLTNTNFNGTAHNALDDAIHQAKYVSMMWKSLLI